jgi:hypothetical protein
MQIYTAIIILEGVSDDWTNNSPIIGCQLSGFQSGFVVSNMHGSFTLSSSYYPLYHRLTGLGLVSREVDILSPISKEISVNTIDGVGGVTKTNDFNFSLDNIKNEINPLSLIGHNVIVYTGTTTDIKLPTDETCTIKLLGKIYNVEPSNGILEFTVRGKFSTWNKEVGSYIASDVDLYKNKIIPIVYGDFTDKNGYIPSVANRGISKLPIIYFGTQKMGSLTSLQIYNKETNEAIVVSQDLSSYSVDSDNKQIEMIGTQSSIFLAEAVDSSIDEIKLFNPWTTTITFEESISTLDARDFGTRGSVYKDSDDNIYEYLGDNLWSCMEISEGEYFDTYTKVYGTGPSTLISQYRTAAKESLIDIKQWEREDITQSDIVYIKIDDEQIRLVSIKEITTHVDYGYSSTTYIVKRGINSTKASHSIYELVYSSVETIKQGKLFFEHIFWPIDAVNFLSKPLMESPVGGDRLDYVTYPDPIDHICSMSKYGIYGEAIYVTDDFDLKFDKISVKGTVLDAFLLGEYSYWLVDYMGDVTCLFCVGGIASWTGKYLFVATPNGWTPGEGDIISNFYPNNMTKGVGYFKYSILQGLKVGDLFERYTNGLLTGQVEESIEVLVYKYNGGVKTSAIHLMDLYFEKKQSLMLPGQNEYKQFSLANRSHQTVISEELIAEPLAYGIVENLETFMSNRFYFKINIPDNPGKVYISNPGLLVQFSSDAIEQIIYGKGTGRVDLSDSLIENPVEIVEDFMTKEVGLVSTDFNIEVNALTATSVAALKSTLLLFGEKQMSIDIMTKFAKENGLLISESNDGKLTIDYLAIPTDWSSLTEITVSDLYLNSSDALDYSEKYTSLDSLINKLTVFYQKNFAVTDSDPLFGQKYEAPEWTECTDLVEDDKSVTLNNSSLRDSTSVIAFSNIMRAFYSFPFRIVTIVCNITVSIRIGQWVKITNSSSIQLKTNDKIYLIVKIDEQLPFGNKEIPGQTITAIEIDVTKITDYWQEIPGEDQFISMVDLHEVPDEGINYVEVV